MSFFNVFLSAGGAILTMMVLLWLWSILIKNSSIVDIFWGIGFVIVTWFVFAVTPQGYLLRKQLIAALVTIWGLRLALHIAVRNWGKPEDFRYAKWRQENGPRWWWVSFFQVFLLQGVLMWIISAPLIAAQTSGFPAILTPLDAIGAIVWTIGFLFESIGDLQLMRFKANNPGKLQTAHDRRMEIHSSPKLFWGSGLVVGVLCRLLRSRRLVDDFLPNPNDIFIIEGLWCRNARTNHENEAGI
jgi:steroid 5-alpha reductase family enzyme